MFRNESKILTLFTITDNISYIVALDEVGRGAGAGPVTVCASLWQISKNPNKVKPTWLPLIDDSKKLTPYERENCFALVCKDYNLNLDSFCEDFTDNLAESSFNLLKPQRIFNFSQNTLKKIKLDSKDNKFFDCICFCLGIASNREIDKINIWNAIQLATNRALYKIQDKINKMDLIHPFQEMLLFLDGHLPIKVTHDFLHIPQVTIVEGDALLKTVGFSSIMAKVCRDRYMMNLKNEFPYMGFEQHKGYLTQMHKANLQKFGTTHLHRQSFLKSVNSKEII